LPVQTGILVARVFEGGAAHLGGLQPGDVITACEGEELKSLNELRSALGDKEPGERVRLAIVSGGNKQEVKVSLGVDGSSRNS